MAHSLPRITKQSLRKADKSDMSIITPPTPDPEWLKPFLSHCHRRKHPAKTEFIHPGDAGGSIFYIVSARSFSPI